MTNDEANDGIRNPGKPAQGGVGVIPLTHRAGKNRGAKFVTSVPFSFVNEIETVSMQLTQVARGYAVEYEFQACTPIMFDTPITYCVFVTHWDSGKDPRSISADNL